jgi:hypothetical protein
MTSDTKDPYDLVLADLIAQRDKLNAAIDAIQAIRGGAPSVTSETPRHPNGSGSAKIESDSFFGLTVLEAAKKYLAMVKRPQKAATITEALQQGGYHFSAANPVATVGALLRRDDNAEGEVVKLPDGAFGLASWYKTRPRRTGRPDEGDSDEQPESTATS